MVPLVERMEVDGSWQSRIVTEDTFELYNENK
jgi:hypothetical protein